MGYLTEVDRYFQMSTLLQWTVVDQATSSRGFRAALFGVQLRLVGWLSWALRPIKCRGH